jgi:Galactose oxidase, central domain
MQVIPRKKHSRAPSISTPAGKVASSQQLHFPTHSQSKSPQEKQQSQTVYPWSAHASPFGQSPPPFLRDSHALSTSATAASELFLFGGYVHSSGSPSNDLYVISTRYYSTTLLQTSGDVPSPRFGHRAMLTNTTFLVWRAKPTNITLLIWGGKTDFSSQDKQNQRNDDSFYLLNLGTSELFHVKIRSS